MMLVVVMYHTMHSMILVLIVCGAIGNDACGSDVTYYA